MNKKRTELIEAHLSVAKSITIRLCKLYPWLERDDLTSYAYIGLIRATESYNPSYGKTFGHYASFKGLYRAIDEMRKDGVLKRKCRAPIPLVLNPLVDEDGESYILDSIVSSDDREGIEARDTFTTLLRYLSKKDQQLMMMRFNLGMTFKEIASVRDVSESATCLRCNLLLRQLRSIAKRHKVA